MKEAIIIFDDWCAFMENYVRQLMSMFLYIVRICIALIGIAVIVLLPEKCYNTIIPIIGGVVFMEILLSLLQQLFKNKIWVKAFVIVFSIMVVDVLAVIAVDAMFGFIHSMGFLTMGSDWEKIAIVMVLQILVIGSVFSGMTKHNNTVSALSVIKRMMIEAIFVGMAMTVAGFKCIGYLTLPISDISMLILLVTLTGSAWLVLYFDCREYMHRQILEKYKEDALLQEVLQTYEDGSVYITYPIRSQSIDSFIEYHIFTLRTPKAAKLSGEVGAWYSVPKRYYDVLLADIEGQSRK